MSSLGSSIGSPSIESFPQPPTPLLSPGYSGDLQSEPLPPPPFPGAVPTLPHPGKSSIVIVFVKLDWLMTDIATKGSVVNLVLCLQGLQTSKVLSVPALSAEE